MVKMVCMFDDKERQFEARSNKPSLTDASTYEPLSIMVDRIIRGELSPYSLARANGALGRDQYDYVGEDLPSSEAFEGVGQINDLTDYDEIILRQSNSRSAESDSSSEECKQPVSGLAASSSSKQAHSPAVSSESKVLDSGSASGVTKEGNNNI